MSNFDPPEKKTRKETGFDKHPSAGGTYIYRGKEGGNFYWQAWLPDEVNAKGGKGVRIRKSLKTKDLRTALNRAEDEWIEVRAQLKAGIRIEVKTLGEVVDAFYETNMTRVRSDEIRDAARIEQIVGWMRKHFSALYGLNKPISSMGQSEWDRYAPYRSQQVSISTVKGELVAIRGLIAKHGMRFGAPLVPVFETKLPKHLRSRRPDTFNDLEWDQIVKALDDYIIPEDTKTNRYTREWAPCHPSRKKPIFIDQDLEEANRKMTRWFALLLNATGCRPHEIVGPQGLTWENAVDLDQKIKFDIGYGVENLRASRITVREKTKTGSRVFAAPVAALLEEIRKWSRFTEPGDFVFAVQTGVNRGKPWSQGAFRPHFKHVVQDIVGITRLEKPVPYLMRHRFITERLRRGASPFLVAKSVGNSQAVIEATYFHASLVAPDVIDEIYVDKKADDSGTVMDWFNEATA